MMVSREQMMGMTTNERLFEANLMGEFDQAIEDRDIDKIRTILRSVFVDEASIEAIINDKI